MRSLYRAPGDQTYPPFFGHGETVTS
jgi:hypothetical protein